MGVVPAQDSGPGKTDRNIGSGKTDPNIGKEKTDRNIGKSDTTESKPRKGKATSLVPPGKVQHHRIVLSDVGREGSNSFKTRCVIACMLATSTLHAEHTEYEISAASPHFYLTV
jgi:hypothetical protein